MSRLFFFLMIAVLSLNLSGVLSAQTMPGLEPEKPLPLDPQVKVGKLDNGLTYYIRVNKKPEKRAEFWLAVNTGSVLEDDDQQGLAHFLEHMAFNGTKNFQKQELVSFLESIGVRFGADLNAHTSFDETVYKLQVPTDSLYFVEKGLQVLEDWAHQMTLDPAEIDKERGVIKEEWRSRRSANSRIFDKQAPTLFKDSNYARRIPIGQMAVIDTAHYETFHRFYRDWYRPELMAVIAVGDFDPIQIENQIREKFSRLKPIEKPRERKVYPMPHHDATLFAIATDPEATRNLITIYHKMPHSPFKTNQDYRQHLVESLFNSMLNKRLDELTRQSEPPFLGAFSSKSSVVRPIDAYILGAGIKDNGVEAGLEALLTESRRANLYGFTAGELSRTKIEMLRGIEQAYNEREKTESVNYVWQYTSYFLDDEPSPGIAFELALYRHYLPQITLEDVNKVARDWIKDQNRVIAVSGPEKADIKIPGETELLAVFDKIKQKEIKPYNDIISTEPLVKTPPKPVAIVDEKYNEKLGLTEWKLANGVRVLLKPTDFKDDQMQFTAISRGGHSLVDDSDYIPASTADAIVNESGVGTFDKITLEKKLAGKLVSVSPSIDELSEGISGSASPQDMETLFQLIYLYVTEPRQDPEAFSAYQAQMEGMLENRSARPETVFGDSINVVMTQRHFRARPWSKEMLKEMDLEKSLKIYKDRFSDAGDFTFYFVGKFDLAVIKPLVQIYLGGLPTKGRQENWRDVGINPPTGMIKKDVKIGVDPKSSVRIIFTGPFAWSRQNRYDLQAMVEVLRILLREAIREEKGGSYGVGVRASTERDPDAEYSVTISFGCSPDRVAELTQTAFGILKKLQNDTLNVDYVAKVKEIQRRKYETDLKENNFWLANLAFLDIHNEDLNLILRYNDLIEHLTVESVQTAARKYLRLDNYALFTLFPGESAK